MFKVQVRFALLALLLPLLLNEASKLIEEMADELLSKTGINGYVIATNENFPERFNLVTYSKKYEDNISKPYVILIFAPNAVITTKSGEKGRVALIPSSKEITSLYDKSDVMDATIDVIAVKDKNTIEDKHNIGVLQGFSELADQIAASKDIEMTTTLPNETRLIVGILEVIVLIGAALVFWMWPHMILGFLALGITLSYWTVKSASSMPVQESNNFMLKYQVADMNINEIIERKQAFDKHYTINIKDVETMEMKDNIHSKRKEVDNVKLVQGLNAFNYTIEAKDGTSIKEANVTFLLTQPHSVKEDKLVENIPFVNGKFHVSDINISKPGRYTLQLRAKVGETIGYSETAAYLKPE
jgi:hypothetical protein